MKFKKWSCKLKKKMKNDKEKKICHLKNDKVEHCSTL